MQRKWSQISVHNSSSTQMAGSRGSCFSRTGCLYLSTSCLIWSESRPTNFSSTNLSQDVSNLQTLMVGKAVIPSDLPISGYQSTKQNYRSSSRFSLINFLNSSLVSVNLQEFFCMKFIIRALLNILAYPLNQARISVLRISYSFAGAALGVL